MSDVVAVQKLYSVAYGIENRLDFREGQSISLIKVEKVTVGSLLHDENVIKA